MKQVLEHQMSRTLQPLCPRDDHGMHFEAKGISWKELPADNHPQTIASYHCGMEGCSVRFDNESGYFTVVLTPDQPYFIEEPGINLLQCPEHHTWLYRSASPNSDERYQWRCGVEGCHYVHAQKLS